MPTFFQIPDVRRTIAANATEAVMIAPAQPICGGNVRETVWTADGTYLLVLRERPIDPLDRSRAARSAELLVWGRKSGRSRTLLTFDPQFVKPVSIEPMGGTDRFVVTTEERVREGDGEAIFTRIALLSASSGATIPISLTRFDQARTLYSAYVSPDRPVGLLERIDNQTKRIRAFGLDGKLGPELPLERLSSIRFDRQGKGSQIARQVDPKTGKGRVMSRPYDVFTGRAGEWTPWKPSGEPGSPFLAVEEHAVTIGRGFRAPSILLMLKGGKEGESGVVSTDGTAAVLSPKNDALVYVDNGMAVVRILTRVDRKAYDDALRAQAITEAVSKAKQVGVGLLIYAADNDDVLPGLGDDVNGKISPYLKNDELLQGFTYTFKGGSLTDVDKPAETEMGYVTGPGGRAVIYADGHAKWIPDGP